MKHAAEGRGLASDGGDGLRKRQVTRIASDDPSTEKDTADAQTNIQL
jgi:hypothetical protein